MTLSDAQIEYYSRQIILREVGARGQRALLASSCLVVGDGRDARTALTYLAGAGIGRLDQLALAADASSNLAGEPFAVPALRNADVVHARESGDAWRSASELDVLLIASDAAAAARTSALAGMPRVGWIRVELRDDGVSLVIAPSTYAGCFACLSDHPIADHGAGEAASRDGSRDADPLALDLAGAMAALAACRWLAKIAPADELRALQLGSGAPAFQDVAVRRLERCPRACRGAGA